MVKKIIILGLLIMSTSLMAVTYEKQNKENQSGVVPPESLKGQTIAKAFYAQLPADTKQEDIDKWNKLIESDKYFKLGNRYIHDKSFQIVKENLYDAEFPGAPKTILLPNYPEAVKAFAKSAELTGNPISAYEGSTIINTYLGLNFKDAKKMQKLFTDILYKAKTCEGYLNKGKSLLYGTLEKKNLTKAKIVLEKGYKKCKDNSFYGMSIYSKMMTAQIKSKKQKK